MKKKKTSKPKFDQLTFKGETTIYIPVWQKEAEEGFPNYTSFQWDFELASLDEQMAWSFEPDEVLVLTGKYEWTTRDKRK